MLTIVLEKVSHKIVSVLAISLSLTVASKKAIPNSNILTPKLDVKSEF